MNTKTRFDLRSLLRISGMSFGVGVVQLGDEVRVEGRLTECEPEKLHIGGDVELTIIPFRTEGDTQVVTFAFKPV